MKRILIILLLIQTNYNLFCQEIEVEVKIINIPNFAVSNELVLGQFYGSDFKLLDKLKFSGDSTQSFKLRLPVTSKTGLYHIFIGDKNDQVINKAEIILSENERPIINADFYQLKDGSVAIDSSIENQAYGDLLAIRDYYEVQLDELYQKRINLSMFSSDFKRKCNEYELQTEIIQSQYNEALSQISVLYPKTFPAKTLVSLALIPVRSSKTEWAKQYDSYFSFLNEHFFDLVDFSSFSILNHYAFSEKIKQYFNNYSEASTDGAEKAINVIMGASSANSEVRSFIYNYLLEIFLKLESEHLTKFLIENYSGNCSLDLPFEELKKLQAIQAISIGGQAPEISLPDIKGKYHSLRSFSAQNKYTIVFFWLSWCSRCQKELPIVTQLYDKYKNKGIGVYTVSLDEKESDWKSKFNLLGKGWTNVAELVPIPKSSIVKNYNISTTPGIYILDKNGQVISKNLYGEDLEKFISELK